MTKKENTAQIPGIAVFISGRGSNLTALADAVDAGTLRARIACVVSNRADAQGIERAARRGLATRVVPHAGLSRAEHAVRLLAALAEFAPDFVCLAGYMRLLAPEFVRAYSNRIVNIHPSLLPAFPGLDAQEQAIAYGVKISGCTVHLVDEKLDHGPIIAQAPVPTRDDDTAETLAARILIEEHRLYPSAMQRLLHEKWDVVGRRVVFAGHRDQEP
jgi:phosphoribosylglycinamide formyltransferase-1